MRESVCFPFITVFNHISGPCCFLCLGGPCVVSCSLRSASSPIKTLPCTPTLARASGGTRELRGMLNQAGALQACAGTCPVPDIYGFREATAQTKRQKPKYLSAIESHSCRTNVSPYSWKTEWPHCSPRGCCFKHRIQIKLLCEGSVYLLYFLLCVYLFFPVFKDFCAVFIFYIYILHYANTALQHTYANRP